MSVRPNKSVTNLNKLAEDNFETEFLLPTEAARTSASSSASGQAMNQSTVLDLGLDWTQRKKLTYTVGNSKIHFQRPIVTAVVVTVFALILLAFIAFHGRSKTSRPYRMHDHDYVPSDAYNDTYPLSKLTMVSQGVFKYKLALVSDLDTDSKVQDKPNTWRSIFKRGHFTWDARLQKVEIDWDAETEIKGTVSMGGRGLELSELVTFNGRLYTVDDRTGIIYWVHVTDTSVRLSPWTILADGDGSETKGFKCEWATVKDRHLYVGGLGKEWTTPEGQLVNFNPMYVKRISYKGEVEHIDWHDHYVKMRSAAGIEFPGYMIHEAVVWSDVHSEWFVLPRRASKYKYNEVDDERHGTNLLLRADADFAGKVAVSRIGELGEPASHGFSSFKFVPGTQDTVIVALKSEELEGKVASFIMVFHIDGTILYPETKVGDHKFEGVEFV